MSSSRTLGTLAHDPLDLLAPFAGIKRSIGLSSRDIDALDAALAESGFFQPAPSGLYLRSEDFFWVGVACIGGRLTFNAWKYPSSRFDNLTFPRLLFAWDPHRRSGQPATPTFAVRHLRSGDNRRQVSALHADRR